MDTTEFEKFVSKFSYQPKSPSPDQKPVVRYKAPEGKSQGERLIQRILERKLGLRYNIDYSTEFIFVEMGRNLRFDFYIRKHNCIIEFDGDQHYRGSRFAPDRETWLQGVERDELKNQFCKDRGISLLRVPQAFVKNHKKLEELVVSFVSAAGGFLEGRGELVYELDLYFQLAAGKLNINDYTWMPNKNGKLSGKA